MTDQIKPLIVWQKWVDPFGSEQDETKWNDYDKTDDSEYDDEYNDDINEIINESPKEKVKVIYSPMGLIPYNEHTASSKIFNFWVGHTNFTITKEIADIIESVDGIEILDIFTRYRFRIAIGKCFDDSDVMSSINNITYDYINNGYKN